MYDIRCRDIMEPNSLARLIGASVTKTVLRPKLENNPNQLTQNSIIKKYHLRKNGTVIITITIIVIVIEYDIMLV